MSIELDVTSAVRNWNENEVEELGAVPSVGDEVIMHSRGQLRSAQVVRIGKKNIDVRYTTKGAIDEAIRIYEHYQALSLETVAKQSRAQEIKNFAFHVQEADPKTAQYSKYKTADEWAHDRAIVAQGETAYVEAIVARTVASAAEGKAKRIENWIHYTTKTVAIDKLYKEKSA